MQNNIMSGFFRVLCCGTAATWALTALPAHAFTLVNTCGQTLSAPGAYILTKNLVCPDTGGDFNGIEISASNVIFHLAGFTISSPACDVNRSINGIFVQGGITGVKIDGGTVRGFNDAMVLSSSHSTVAGMTLREACVFGVAVSGQNNRLEKNWVTGNKVDGIGLGQASGMVITANDISSNKRTGVGISNFSDNNVVENNMIFRNGVGEGYGVAISNGTNNTIRNNVVNNNFNGIGIDAPGNVVRSNKVNGSRSTGVAISAVGAPSTVQRNTVLGNRVTDMSDGSADCDGNTWGTPLPAERNSFRTDRVVGVSDGGPGTGCIR